MGNGPTGTARVATSEGAIGLTGTGATGTGNVTTTVKTSNAAGAGSSTGPVKIGADFLRRVVPWPQAGAQGFINLHWTIPDGKGGMPGKPFADLVSLLSFVPWANNHPKWMKDIYFCLSLQAETGLTKAGKIKAARHANAALALKALWLDVDGYKDYPSKTDALAAIYKFVKDAGLPLPTALVDSGGGWHVYWISDRPLTTAEWGPYADGLWALVQKHGLKADPVTTDAARVLRLPGTFNKKQVVPRPVELKLLQDDDIDFAATLGWLKGIAPPRPTTLPHGNAPVILNPELFKGGPAAEIRAAVTQTENRLGDGIEEPLSLKAICKCPHYADALRTGGKTHNQGLWMQTVLGATWIENAREVAHAMSNKHPGYSVEECDAMFDRKMGERGKDGLGWPGCHAFEANGCKLCASCVHKGKIKSPLNLARLQPSPLLQPSFVDPYAEFAGPAFPLDVLPPTLSKFVDAEYRAMGADPSAIAMAALTTVAGAMHAETRVLAGEGWLERPIFWTTLVGQPSTMKSPIIEKATKPLIRIDAERNKRWRQEYAIWKKLPKATQSKTPPPPKPPRCIVKDATPEKVAEILSRDPSGSLMVHDELAGWLGGFDRYNSGQSSRAFYLTCWSGGPYTQDRVGKGKRDADAEIHVDNLALCVLGGIQPDRLAELHDLTSDGLLQRFQPVLMAPAERGDEYHPVAQAEADYEKLIKSINSAPSQNYHFEDDALEVRDGVNDYLHKLEMVDAFSPALIGAIGKLKGYFARICLVLHAAMEHDPISRNERLMEVCPFPERFTLECREHIRKLIGLDPNVPNNLGAGLDTSRGISRRTAEAAEKAIRQFLLPHIWGLYDVVVNGGKDRDQLRSIGDFILASNKDRLRQSDLTSGVRTLRGEPEHKIREQAGRFCAMGWLQPAEEKPGVPPKAWFVVPGLRDHFAERRKQAQEARAEAHAILKAGGSRRPAQQRV